MGLQDDVQHIMDMAVKASPAGLRALTEGPQEVSDPIGDLVMPMLAAYREAILLIASEIDKMRDEP